MPKVRLLIVLLALPLIGACSSTGKPQSNPAPGPVNAAVAGEETARAQADEDDLICKKIIKTGTRLRTRQCLTEGQWEALAQGGRDAVDETQRRASHAQDMPGQ